MVDRDACCTLKSNKKNKKHINEERKRKLEKHLEVHRKKKKCIEVDIKEIISSADEFRWIKNQEKDILYAVTIRKT